MRPEQLHNNDAGSARADDWPEVSRTGISSNSLQRIKSSTLLATSSVRDTSRTVMPG